MWDLLTNSFAQQGVILSPGEQDLIQTTFTFKKFRKHQYILQEGDVCRYKTFILKGLTRGYTVDEKGQEHILLFGAEGSWVEDLHSLNKGVPTEINIDCLEETEVLQVSKSAMDMLFESVPQLNKYFRLLLQDAVVSLAQRMAYNLSKPVAERYYNWIDRFPHIERRISNQQIASYLGITPQSLSRLRRQTREQSQSLNK
ncbi:MAG TPA: Crp/Fnr family transcriptional regulator [Flavisolibacter sp.]|jgi:CRP-like cAMP-binding protein|nr:Crp/Fnr family transcriptional regulator [Flavisolibacter sp.]